jgi:hypothetical protein
LAMRRTDSWASADAAARSKPVAAKHTKSLRDPVIHYLLSRKLALTVSAIGADTERWLPAQVALSGPTEAYLSSI